MYVCIMFMYFSTKVHFFTKVKTSTNITSLILFQYTIFTYLGDMNFKSHFEMEGGLTVSTRSVICSIRTAKLCRAIVFFVVHQEIMRGKTSLTSLTLCYHLTN